MTTENMIYCHSCDKRLKVKLVVTWTINQRPKLFFSDFDIPVLL